MGIYLPDMEMPRKGQMLVIFPDGTSYVCFNGMRERLAQTKAVPVPPHGDLIERKVACNSILEGMVMTGYQSRALDCISEFYVPTIIPADPSVDEAKIQSEFLQNWHEEGET